MQWQNLLSLLDLVILHPGRRPLHQLRNIHNCHYLLNVGESMQALVYWNLIHMLKSQWMANRLKNQRFAKALISQDGTSQSLSWWLLTAKSYLGEQLPKASDFNFKLIDSFQRLYDHSTFKKDALLGEHTLNLFNVLKTREGKCQNSTISLDLTHDAKQVTACKIGELVVVLDGLNIDMKAVASPAPVVSVVPSPFPPENGLSSSSSSKQRRRTTGDPTNDAASRLPPLNKNQTRGSSVSSLNATASANGKLSLSFLH